MPVWLISLLVGVVLQVAGQIATSMARQDAPKPKRSKSTAAGGMHTTLEYGGDLPPRFIVGNYGTAGQLRYAGSWGNVGGTPNAYLSRAIEVSCLPIRGYSGWLVDGERVTLADHTTGDFGYAVLEYRNAGKDHLWIKPYLGDQVAADPLMLAKFGGDAARPYAGMVGRGCGYFVVTALVNRELFNGIPEIIAEVDGIELDDPRGDDQHDNPIVAAYTLLKGLSYDGEWIYGPQGITEANFRAANLEAEADKCDAARELAAGGTEKRFRIGMDVGLDEEPQAIIGELLKGCSGRWADLGDVYRFLVGDPGDPVFSFTDDDIIISEGQTYDPFPGLEAIANAMTATYPSAAAGWAMVAAPPRYSDELEDEDAGLRLPFSTVFRAVPYPVQVQELMATTVADGRRFRRHSFTAPPEWWELEPLDAVAWTSARNGYDSKAELISTMEDLPTANQFVGLQEIDPVDYNSWSSDQELPHDVAQLVVVRPAPQVSSGITFEPYIVVDTDGGGRRAGIEVFLDAGLIDVQAVRVQIAETWEDERVVADATFDYDVEELDPSRVIANPAILPDRLYEARAIYRPYSGRVTRWSNQDEDGTEGDWATVMTPNIPDVDIPPIEVTMLGTELQNDHALLTDPSIGGSIPDQLQQLHELADTLALAVMSVADTVKQRLDILDAQREGAAAAIVRNDLAIVTETEARVASSLEIIAQLGNAIAGGYLLFEGVANTDTAEVSISAKVKAAFGNAVSQAAWMLRSSVTEDGDEAVFAVYGKLDVFVPTLGGFTTAIDTLDDGTVRFSGTRMGRIDSLDGRSYIDFEDGIDIYSESD